MPKFTVYFRGLIGKIGLLYLSSKNKKFKRDSGKTFVKTNADIIIIYFIGFLMLVFLTINNSIIIGTIGTLLFGAVFVYDILNPYGYYSRYEQFGSPKDLFNYH
jgi:hypothetical protein